MATNKKYFSGNSIEQAVLQAARHFKMDASEVAYRQVERRHGFLKTRRRAVIEVDVDNPRLAAGESAPEAPEGKETSPTTVDSTEAASDPAETDRPAQPKRRQARRSEEPARRAGEKGKGEAGRMTSLPDRPARKREPVAGEIADAAQEAVRRLCALGELHIEADVYQGENGLEIEIHGEDEGQFLEDRGRLLLAMQHLMPRLIRGLTGESVPCRVDCDNFQEVREEQLRVLAQRTAAEVRDRGRAKMLEPMSPDERRIVHMTLADDSAVDTESQGTGLFKRVRVIPASRRARTFEPYKR